MAPRIAIVDYRKGNLKSVERGIDAAGGDAFVACDPAAIAAADAGAASAPARLERARTGNGQRVISALLQTGAVCRRFQGVGRLGGEHEVEGFPRDAERGHAVLTGRVDVDARQDDVRFTPRDLDDIARRVVRALPHGDRQLRAVLDGKLA